MQTTDSSDGSMPGLLLDGFRGSWFTECDLLFALFKSVADNAIDTFWPLPRNRARFRDAQHGGGVCCALEPQLFYATADQAEAYMFYMCFLGFFFCFFRPSQKNKTTVLGNG